MNDPIAPAEIRRSRTGLGLFAVQSIWRGTRIVRYTGELIPVADEHRLMGVYLMALDERFVIDGRSRSNAARYVNHSCRPNAYAEVIDGEIWIVAKRRIKAAEEITIDYGRNYFEILIAPDGCRCLKCSPSNV